MIKVRVEMTHDGSDEDRYYYRDIEMPFVPFVGLEMEFCDCCSGYKIKYLTYNHSTGVLLANIQSGDLSRPAAFWTNLYDHWGFVEDEGLRGCSMGKANTI